MQVDTRSAITVLRGMSRVYDAAPLDVWTERLRGALHGAVRTLSHQPFTATVSDPARSLALRGWFGVVDAGHPFHQPVEPWLQLFETQVVKGLAYYLNQHGQPALLACLRAIAPAAEWPADLRDLKAGTEVETSGGQRIDLIVSGKSGKTVMGAVVEAKWGSGLHNSLSHYKRHATRKRGMCETRTAFIVLDFATGGTLEKKLARNEPWKFRSWRSFLRNLEVELNRAGIADPDFARHRQRLWRSL